MRIDSIRKQSVSLRSLNKQQFAVRPFPEKLFFWGVVFITVLGVTAFSFAWSNPTVAPPGGSLSASINTGSTAQTKTGGLTIQNTFSTTATTTLATSGGSVGIGTTTPNGLLDVNGKLTVLSSGSVGIGTTGPTNGKLEVQAGAGNPAYFQSSSDAQLQLKGTDAWAGIIFMDVSATDYIWYNGGNSTFAIGGGGSNVAGKKLHINGGTSIGSGYAASAPPTGGLIVEGAVKVGGSETGDSTSDIKAYIQKIACQARRGVWVDNTGCTEYAYYTSTSGAWTASPCAAGYHLCTWGDLWSGGFSSLRRPGYWPATSYVWIAGAYWTVEQNMFYPWGYQNYANTCVAGTHFMLDMLSKGGTNAWGCYVDSYVNVSACCNNSQ